MKILLVLNALILFFIAQLSAQDNRNAFTEGKVKYSQKAYYEAYQRFSAAYTLSKNSGDAAYQDSSRIWIQKSAESIRAEQQHTDSLLQATRKLTDAFYFYDDRLALAYQEFYDRGRFGFINRQGEVVIDYEYTSATNFDEVTGYAKVEKEGKRYWLAPDGTEYPIEKAVEDLPVVSTKENSSSSNEQQEASMTNSLEGLRVNSSKDYHQELQKGIDLYDERDYFASFQHFNAVNVLAENDNNNRVAELGSQLRDSAVQRIQLLAIQAADALEVAQNIRRAFFFYSGKYALAFGEKKGRKVFYYINENGEEFKELRRWAKAEHFDRYGFAKVIDKTGEQYLLDTTGQAYQVAYRVEDLQPLITALDLRESLLGRFPPEIANNPQLEVTLLDRLGNRDDTPDIPSSVKRLSYLRILSLEWCGIRRLPPEIGQLTNLVQLNLESNKIRKLPPEIRKLNKLERLDLAINLLRVLPPEIGKLKKLEQLYFRENQLKKLPLEIGELKKLEWLDFRRNRLKKLPPEIGELKRLESLGLGYNRLKKLPPEIGELKKLELLDLGWNRLGKLPLEIGQLTELISLGLSDNELTSLPAEIGQLTNLIELDLDGNELTSLPAEIGQLNNLTGLYLYDNQLTSLPPEITQLTNLTRLNLRHNQLTSLPPEISKLTKLTWLSLEGNKISPAARNHIRKLLPNCTIKF